MKTNGKILGAIAFSLALAGGGMAGAVIGVPSISGAQGEPTETTQAGHNRRAHPDRLATAAEAIGISTDDLREALKGGQSIAEVAEANGVEAQTVIDALVAKVTTHLEGLLAELPDRIAEAVNRQGPPDHAGPGQGGPGHGGPGQGGPGQGGRRGPGLEAAASAIGISVEDLRTAVMGGDTVAEVAAANNVEVQTVIDALIADATTHLNQAVADGHLSEADAAKRAAHLSERITAMVNGTMSPGGPGRQGPPSDMN